MALAPTSTNATQAVTLNPGQSFVLPPNAVVTGVYIEGDITYTSTCDLPEPGVFVCGRFYMNIDDDDNDNHPNDQLSTIFSTIKIAGNIYPLSGLLLDQSIVNLNTLLNVGALFTFTSFDRFSISDPGLNKRTAVYLYFKVPDTLADGLELTIIANSGMAIPVTEIYRPESIGTCPQPPAAP